MAYEYNALMDNNTYNLVHCRESTHVPSYKWIYKVKYNSDRSIKQCKARLVVRWFNQQVDLDYHEAFSLVIKSTTIYGMWTCSK